eukprot:CAMPEP_0113238896 /NCGR_PEP_ID=MMETSP0008_2-20120614/5410_1 /TAXON_ID=97485 /ORGANISM="Prymnesium parvum" /LENGTH=104 /DNA_ID=CAMNT_0000086073 /DNA_START=1018 /DNA_END=1333 /DNA_ORIENTATION=- /assembly_acc=CAM_ASM_000153
MAVERQREAMGLMLTTFGRRLHAAESRRSAGKSAAGGREGQAAVSLEDMAGNGGWQGGRWRGGQAARAETSWEQRKGGLSRGVWSREIPTTTPGGAKEEKNSEG